MKKHRCCFIGQDIEELGMEPQEIKILLEKVIDKAIEDGYVTFITGLSCKIDTLLLFMCNPPVCSKSHCNTVFLMSHGRVLGRSELSLVSCFFKESRACFLLYNREAAF